MKKEVTLQKYSLTMKDIKRHEIIKSWLKREITGDQVSSILGISYRHALRLKKAFKEKGLEGIVLKKRGGRKGIPKPLRKRVSDLFKGKEVSVEHEETHIEKILNDLGITLIPANSPQAKGRIERAFGTLQDRLINEMWLAKVKTYEEANNFLKDVFVSYWNKKFKRKSRLKGSVYKSIRGTNLDLAFTKRYIRTVTNDSTISFYNQEIIIPLTRRRLKPARKKVEVRLSSKGIIWVLYKNKVICRTEISNENSLMKTEKRIENILKHRSYG